MVNQSLRTIIVVVDPVENTEAIGRRLIQLTMAKFRSALCDKDSTVSETNLTETKQVRFPAVFNDNCDLLLK